MLFRRRDNRKHFAVENLTKTFLVIRLIIIRGKVVLCLIIIKHYAMKAYGGVDV
jgi:expansin (peptidoglycan-binding protein)